MLLYVPILLFEKRVASPYPRVMQLYWHLWTSKVPIEQSKTVISQRPHLIGPTQFAAIETREYKPFDMIFLMQRRRRSTSDWWCHCYSNLDPRDCNTEVQTISGEALTLKAETKLQPPSKEVRFILPATKPQLFHQHQLKLISTMSCSTLCKSSNISIINYCNHVKSFAHKRTWAMHSYSFML